jgi:hypothetical protein
MGLYTELVIACELRPNPPLSVIQEIKWWIGEIEYDPQWARLTNNTDSPPWYYDVLNSYSPDFPGEARCTLTTCAQDTYCLTIRTSRKNYNLEYEHFLQWLAPHSATEGFVGSIRSSIEDSPRLIYFYNGKAKLRRILSYDEADIIVNEETDV